MFADFFSPAKYWHNRYHDMKLCTFNPFPDEQLNLVGNVPKQVRHFTSLSISCWGCQMICRRAARRLIDLHPKQDIEFEVPYKMSNLLDFVEHKMAVWHLKGLNVFWFDYDSSWIFCVFSFTFCCNYVQSQECDVLLRLLTPACDLLAIAWLFINDFAIL